MTDAFDEADLRHWLTDYMVTSIGCSPDDVDPNASFNDLGVGSRDSVVLSGELADRIGRPVSPVEFWEHPTINSLARFLTQPEPEFSPEPVSQRGGGSIDEPIAVIGLGCRFPAGINGPEPLWQFLDAGGSAITQVPADRWAPFDDGSAEVAALLSDTTKWGAFLDDVDAFDAEFFDILPREAAKMDPQQRLLLEVAWEALEHAGTAPNTLRHSQTGVFIGACVSEYGYLASADLPTVDAWNNTGGALSIIANRLSYFLDLRGPSLTVDTACSSSLVAIHLACQSLRTGDSDVALAGGVNLLMSPAVFRGFDQAAALSPTGACHSFDAAADGFVRGEGCGVAVLKRLSDAQRDGDRVLAVVRGSAVNQDGKSNGLMAPNPAAQMAVLRRAYDNAGFAPRDVDYVEAHGTGTFLGDPIEARALGTVLGKGRPADAPLLIGAVKSNLGHLEAAAGIAGFIKTVLAVQRARIPGNQHFDTPNPHIAFDKLRLKVAAEHQDWPARGRARRAGVSSFGFGGTNAHIVLEQAPANATAAAVDLPEVTTLPIFGKTDARIASTAATLADWMTGAGAGVPLADIAHTLRHHRDRSNRVASVCVRDRSQALEGLRALATGEPADTVIGPVGPPTRSGTVFVYSGQGSHWTGMGRRLLADEPAFAAAIAELEPTFVEQVGFSLQQVLSEGETVRGDAQVQPVLVGLQLALTQLWRSYGIHPDAVIGHSVGEVSAAVVSGALSVADGLKVVAHRSRLMSRLAGQGAVALLKLDAEATEAAIADFPSVSVAGRLAPRQTVIAGLPDQVDAVIAAMSAQNRFARRVNMEVASHTALMDEVLPELRAELADLAPNSPAIPFFSTVFAPTDAPVHDAAYWAANVRRPVRFADAVVAAAQDHGTFVEISAHPVLVSAVAETLEGEPHSTVATLRRDGDDTLNFHLGVAAVNPQSPVAPHPPEPHPVLPTTPWHHTRHWITVAEPRRTAVTGGVPAEWYSEMTWPTKELAASAPQTVGSWLVVAEPDVVAEVVAELGPEIHVNTLAPSALEHAEPTALIEVLAGTSHVLYAPEVTSSGLDAETGYRLFHSAKTLTTAITRMMLPPKLFLLTRDAQPLAEGDAANPAQAVLWGLGRTLALEHPEMWGAVIDVEAATPARDVARIVLAEATGGDGEDQVVHRNGSRHAPRLRRVTPARGAAVELDGDDCHLVIGATGNIGPHLITQLAAMKASTIVAVSRNPGDRLDELAAALQEKGSTLITVAADAADADDMRALFDRFGDDLPALGGIYLAAFGGGPVTLSDMSDRDVEAMFRPKLDVLALLHELSLPHAVKQFVLFSSISGLLGSRWLAHYAATTTYLDTFAYARRAAGLAATTVNWGFWKSLADHQSPEELNVTVSSGLLPMADDVAITALSSVTDPRAGVRSCVVAADWDLLATAYRTRAALHVVDDLIAGDDPAAVVAGSGGASSATIPSTDFRQSLRGSAAEGRRALLAQHVTALVATVMGLESPHLLDPKAGFFHFGMDSLMSVTLQRALTTSLGISVPASVVFDYPTVDALVGHLAATLPEFQDEAPEPAGDDYDHLTEDELFALLSERLGSTR